MENRPIAEAFPPGEFIKEELEARGWTQSDLADIMGRQKSVVSAIINGKRSVSPEVASELASAFGTSADLWLNLQMSYDLHVRKEQKDDVSRRARIFSLVPIKEMIRRGWIQESDDLDALERGVADFLNQPISAVFHRSESHADITPAQRAWLCQAHRLARGVQAAKFSKSIFAKALDTLRRLLMNPEDVRHVAKVLAEGGVRFLIIESLPHTKIDGACFWLNEFSPVIVLTMRYDRLDNFWYVLTHECGHVSHGDGLDGNDVLDVNLVGDDAIPFENKPDIEKRADMFATNFLVEPSKIDDFIARVRPMF